MDQKVWDIIEKVKATAAHAAVAAGKAADAASRRAGELMEVTKLNLKIFDLNTDIEMLMGEIGKKVYLTHTGVEVDSCVIEEKIRQIDEKYEQIGELKGLIAAKKTVYKCGSCGKECEKTDAYCSACGAAVE